MNMIKKGFTLIELMIVVAIVGVLAAIALPVYQDYIARSQVSEAVASAGAVKNSIAEYYASLATYPPANEFTDTTPGRYTVGVVQGAGGVITGKMGPASPVNSRVWDMEFTLTPTTGAADGGGTAIVNWTCQTVVPAKMKYLPSGCKDV